MRWGFFGLRGLNEFLDEDGAGVYFTLRRDGAERGRFFPNVGQPDPRPPFNPAHKDDPSYDPDVRILKSNFHPFHIRYLLGGNLFEWIEWEGKILLRAELEDEAVFRRCDDTVTPSEGVILRAAAGGVSKDETGLHVTGIDWGKPVTGAVRAVLSDADFEPFDREDAYRAAVSALPPPDPVRSAAQASVLCNLMTDAGLANRFYVPVNRTWTNFLGALFGIPEPERTPQIFGWDTSLASVILASFDRELARANLLSLLEGQRPDGRIAQIRIGGRYSNRTNPPVWFIAAGMLAEGEGGAEFAGLVYPALERNYDWFLANRANGGALAGTFSWGTDEGADTPIRLTGKTGAVFESGLDDSPLFDGMELSGGKLDYACIDLTSLMVRAAEIMLELAATTGRDGGRYAEDLERFGRAMPGFFDYENGIANSFKMDGGKRVFAREITPVSFYPLLTGLAGERETRLLEALFDSGHFRGTLPSLSRLSRHFTADGDYWRGRIWPPMVWLAAKGFERHGSPVYGRIRDWAHGLLRAEWERDGHVHENYSALTGRGEPQAGVYARSCPLYSWGGLLGVL